MLKRTLIVIAAASALALPAVAQAPAGKPGAPEVSRVTAGTYKSDPDHTQVLWSIDHLGVTPLHGMFGGVTGTLVIDPAKPEAAKVDVTIPVAGLRVSSAGFDKHLRTPDFFDEAKFPTARFVSTAVKVEGQKAVITGDLTLRGVTKPVVLETTFYGAGANPMNKALNVGFVATGKIKRSDFGLGLAAPMVSDEVGLRIIAAFTQ